MEQHISGLPRYTNAHIDTDTDITDTDDRRARNLRLQIDILLVCSSASVMSTSTSLMPSTTTDTSDSSCGFSISSVAWWINCSKIGSATEWMKSVDTDRSACWHTEIRDWTHFSRTWKKHQTQSPLIHMTLRCVTWKSHNYATSIYACDFQPS